MTEINQCAECGNILTGFNQIGNIFYVCTNQDCRLYLLIKLDLKKSLDYQKETLLVSGRRF
jgi:hypothetical protein